MQFAQLASLVTPAVIVKPVSQVARLLDLVERDVGADGVHHARRVVNHVARLNGNLVEQLRQRALFGGSSDLRGADVLPEAAYH